MKINGKNIEDLNWVQLNAIYYELIYAKELEPMTELHRRIIKARKAHYKRVYDEAINMNKDELESTIANIKDNYLILAYKEALNKIK